MLKANHSADAINSLATELNMMIQTGLHVNIVYFLGAVTKNTVRGQIMLIFEYCQFGSVDIFLRDNAQRFVSCWDTLQNYEPQMTHADQADNTDTGEWQLRTTDLISWASQVANGMEYLSSKNILHGDLAARNVLLYSLQVVKISDFGLSRKLERGIYIKSSDSPLPYKWLALECFTNHTFSVTTDVWAFGVFLWELFSLGAMPYPGVTDVHSNRELYDLMLSCWYVAPDRRPDFRELASVFNAMLPVEMRDVYIALKSKYIQQAILTNSAAPTVEESSG
ncbi:fibroblast growth factor receptor-like [Anopheles coustani]|uniref:fibroblast growth factor receptor-like n=1 Tax=Anopheles coustani TaxID=139045 RepID=UPI00265AE436|nr:fibroblast growth factor receptor-like [Anopheles coustani]